MSYTYQNNINFPQGQRIVNNQKINLLHQLPPQQISKNEYNSRVDN